MARLQIGTLRVEADLTVFDKDGTLVDFQQVWSARAIRAVAALGDRLDAALHDAMLQGLGVDRASGRVDGSGVLAQASHDTIQESCLATLVAAGVERAHADAALRTHFATVMRAPLRPEEMIAIGDIPGLFEDLRTGGVHIGVLTADDREATLQTLAVLDVQEHVAHLVCGNDPVAAKPAPDGLLQIAETLGVAPERALMVGDTAADMHAGRAAGSFCVGVATGACDAAQLRGIAHTVIDSVHDIRVLSAG